MLIQFYSSQFPSWRISGSDHYSVVTFGTQRHAIHELDLYLSNIYIYIYMFTILLFSIKKKSTTTESANKQLLFLLGILQTEIDASVPVGGSPIYKERGCPSNLLRVTFWYILGCSVSKVPQRELLRYLWGNWPEKIWQDIMSFCRIGTSLSWTKIFSHAHKTGSLYLLGVLFKISDEHPRPFHRGVSPELHIHSLPL